MPGAGIDDLVVSYEGSGVGDRRWMLMDERGSVIALTGGSGSVLNINTYDEYGVPGSGNAGRFQYTGQMWLPDAGVYHDRARAYAPGIGRFLQPDPMGYAAGMGLYAYVGGDPVNWTDPLGLQRAAGDPCIIAPMLDRCDPTQLTDISVTGHRSNGGTAVPGPPPNPSRARSATRPARLADGSPHPLKLTEQDQCKLEAAADYLSAANDNFSNAAAVTLAGTIYGAWSTSAYPPASGAIIASGTAASGLLMASGGAMGGLSAFLRFVSNGNSIPLIFEIAGGRAGDTLGPILGKFLGLLDKSLGNLSNYKACSGTP